MADIKPIETVYNGYRFRSRLEARWAVFFDALGIKYDYEPEGYCSMDGTCYLPDFYLPDFRCLFEIKRGGLFENGAPKSDFLESQDWKKINAMTESIKIRNDGQNFDYIIIASGSPFDCIGTAKTDCGLLFNGIIGFARYIDDDGNKNPQIVPFLEKDGLPVWGHMPVVFEHLSVSGSGEEVTFFGKRSYSDFEKTKGKYELIPIGKRCTSICSIMHGVVPRYRGEPLYTPTDYVALDIQRDSKSPICSASLKARQARFEHGEIPII